MKNNMIFLAVLTAGLFFGAAQGANTANDTTASVDELYLAIKTCKSKPDAAAALSTAACWQSHSS